MHEKRLVRGTLGVCAAAFLSVGMAFGTTPRTVSVSTFDAGTGAVVLTLDTGDPAEIYVVGDRTDKGASFDAGWALTNRLGSVTGDATSFSGMVPAGLKKAASKIRFFALSHPAGNPVAYITSSAAKSSDATEGSWIDTGYRITQDTVVETWMKGKSNCAPFGYTTWLYFFLNGTSGFSSFFNSPGNYTASAAMEADFRIWKIGKDGAFLDGQQLVSGYTPQSAPGTFSTMALFGRRTAYNGTALGKMGVVSMGWFKIREGDAVQRDFIAWKKPDGTGCMLDQANLDLPNGGFYENQNTTYPFACGEDLAYDLSAPYMTFSEGSAVQTLEDGLSTTVSDVTVTQSATSHRVAVGYTLGTVPEGTRAIVTAQVCVDGQPVNGQHLVGDVNVELDAGDHTFYWLPDLDAPGVDMQSVTVNVQAWKTNAPPAYIAFDMRWQAGDLAHPPRFFNSTNELEGTIGSDLWRTDYLLMRRINANGALFRMGNPSDDVNRTRYVTFTNDYYIGVFELTQGQFMTCVTNLANPSVNHVKVGDTWRTCPLENISVSNFRIGGSGGNNVWPFYGREVGSTLKYRPLAMMRLCTGAMLDLPTEAQWEFACRAGTGTTYYNGTEAFAKTESRNMYNPVDNNTTTWTSAKLPTAKVEEGGTARVGSFAPNPWGLYDLYGNVWETCLDQYVADLPFEQNTLETPFVEPVGSRTITEMSKVNYVRRGGGWAANTNSGSNSRNETGSSNANNGNGYRLVCPVPYGKTW